MTDAKRPAQQDVTDGPYPSEVAFFQAIGRAYAEAESCPTAPDGRHLPTVEPKDGTYRRVCHYCGEACP